MVLITVNKTPHFKHVAITITSLILAFVLVFPILGMTNVPAVLSFLLMFMILQIILLSMSRENLSNEMPSTLYPSLPHMGLDGISVNNYVAGGNLGKL